MNQPKNDSRHFWTAHAWAKMRQYGLSEQRLKRVIRFPRRTEEGILENTVAAMQPASIKHVDGKPAWTQEIWVMYAIEDPEKSPARESADGDPAKKSIANYFLPNKRLRIITAWKYPGMSPKRDPIPEDILSELSGILRG